MAYTWFNPPQTDDAGNPIAGTTSQPVATPTPAPTTPSVPYYGYVDPTSTDPNAIAANLINTQYNEWMMNAAPLFTEALNQSSQVNPQVLTQAVSTAEQNATGTSESMGGILARRNQAAGLAQTPQQQATTSRMLNVQGSLNYAGAANQARTNQRNLDQEILMGMSSGLSAFGGA